MYILVVDNDNSGENSAIVESLLRGSRRKLEKDCTIKFIHDIGMIKGMSSPPAPDVIIIDITDPDSIPEIEILTVVSEFMNSAIVVLASSDNIGVENNSFKLGVQDFISKGGINVGSLWKSINYAINRKRMELSMRSDRENLDKANSILKVTSEISRSILAGTTDIEEMMSAIGASLGVDGVAIFCGKCLRDGVPYCGWTGGKTKEKTYLSTDCRGEEPLSEEVSRFIKYNLPVFTMISNSPESVRNIVSWNTFSNTNKVVIVPIMIDCEPWGMVCFYTINGKTWSVAEMDALATLSRLGGAIVKNKLLEDEMLIEVHERFSEVNRLMSRRR